MANVRQIALCVVVAAAPVFAQTNMNRVETAPAKVTPHPELKHPGRRVGTCGPGGPAAPWEQLLGRLDPGLLKGQVETLDDHAANVDLAPKDRALILVGLDAFVEAQSPYFDCDIDTAYELGASSMQLAEVIVTAGQYEGNHVVQNGFVTLQRVSEARRKAGKPAPDKNGIAPAANTSRPSGSTTPYPWIFQRYLADVYGNRGNGALRELEYKTREMVVVAIDAAISWPDDYFAVHINNAFDNGATIQELMEVVMLAGDVKGVHASRAGTEALDRILRQRILRGHQPPYRHGQPTPPPETPGYPALRLPSGR